MSAWSWPAGSPPAGLVLLAATQAHTTMALGACLVLAGAASRLVAGYWSDRAGSRMRPMRALALAISASLVALAVAARAASPLAVPALLVAAVLAVSTNGLAFTAVAEYAGPQWAGRALGIQNTGQNLVAAVTPPAVAVLIASGWYPAAFALAGVFPLIAAAVVPVAALDAIAGRA